MQNWAFSKKKGSPYEEPLIFKITLGFIPPLQI